MHLQCSSTPFPASTICKYSIPWYAVHPQSLRTYQPRMPRISPTSIVLSCCSTLIRPTRIHVHHTVATASRAGRASRGALMTTTNPFRVTYCAAAARDTSPRANKKHMHRTDYQTAPRHMKYHAACTLATREGKKTRHAAGIAHHAGTAGQACMPRLQQHTHPSMGYPAALAPARL